MYRQSWLCSAVLTLQQLYPAVDRVKRHDQMDLTAIDSIDISD